MDDFSEKLAEILNNPQQMEQVRQMAEQLLGSAGDQPSVDNPPPAVSSGNTVSDGLDSIDVGRIMRLLTQFRSTGQDDRTRLLLALKPHLSEPRREKIDTAVKLLRLVELLPLLRESGLLNF
ncbi:MAG: hypothetical protein IKI29_02770 [Clostridia bacterium]|nr:hypothetical protein [Clostridia bacterium]